MNNKKGFNVISKYSLEFKVWVTTNIMLLCLVLIIFCSIFIRQYVKYLNIKKEYVYVANILEKQRPLISKKNRLIQLKKELEEKSKILNLDALAITKILDEIAKIIPEKCSLNELTFEQNKKIVLKGLVDSNTTLKQFMNKLTNDKIFPVTELKNIIYNDSNRHLNFEIEIHL